MPGQKLAYAEIPPNPTAKKKAPLAGLEGPLRPAALPRSEHSGLPSPSHFEDTGTFILHVEEEGRLEITTGLIPHKANTAASTCQIHLPVADPQHSQVSFRYQCYHETAPLASLRWLVALTILFPTQPQEFTPGSCRVRPGATPAW